MERGKKSSVNMRVIVSKLKDEQPIHENTRRHTKMFVKFRVHSSIVPW